MKPKICVVGSSNMDLISYVPRLPVSGETIHGDRFVMGFGGKGANQAVMAAKLGAEVVMVTKLGEDIFGRRTLENFKSFHIATDYVSFTQEASSGVAPIAVDPRGRNSIIVVGGANNLLGTGEVEAAAEAIRTARVLICQLEIPVESTLRALEIARRAGVTTILNPAPAMRQLPEGCYSLTDVFCPNETEAELLTGIAVTNAAAAELAARELLARGARTVILTLGERGSLLADRGAVLHVPAEKVDALDTTGAGDAFVGSLAYYLARGRALPDAVSAANRVAALSVQKPGTQSSYPDSAELPAELR